VHLILLRELKTTTRDDKKAVSAQIQELTSEGLHLNKLERKSDRLSLSWESGCPQGTLAQTADSVVKFIEFILLQNIQLRV